MLIDDWLREKAAAGHDRQELRWLLRHVNAGHLRQQPAQFLAVVAGSGLFP